MKNIGIFDAALDILFPPRCFICGDIIGDYSSRSVCNKCDGKLSLFSGKSCCCCSSALLEKPGFCGNCSRNFYLDGNISFSCYNELTRDVIHRFKYKDHPEYGWKIAKYMAGHLDLGFIKDIDAVTFVPLYWSKQRKRGFNQAQLIAEGICKELGLPPAVKALDRIRKTDKQSSIEFHNRGDNVKNAFAVRKKQAAAGKSFLLVDDIFTSGSTVNECARMLKTAGAAYVLSLTFAVTEKM